MADFRFILEPYSTRKSRYDCPSCKKQKTFTRYIDLTTNEYLSSIVGICDRLQKCGYHYPPKQFFEDKKISPGAFTGGTVPLQPHVVPNLEKPSSAVSYIDQEIFEKSLDKNMENHFISFLKSKKESDEVDRVISMYRIGTSSNWRGGVVFWQIDDQNRIRTGKVMKYNKATGKKSKVNWMHSMLHLQEYNLQQCLFGLHLVDSDTAKPIGIVESEKTAVIASMAFPEYIWMATGGLMNLKPSFLEPLINRHVVLFPDAGCYNLWKDRIIHLPKNIKFNISELVEKSATPYEKEDGFDLADYILRIWNERIENKS